MRCTSDLTCSSMTAAQYDTPVMGISLVGACESILMKAFGRPQGALGRLGGLIMARANRECAAWVIDLLEIRPHDRILEVGFGPGVGVELLTKLVTTGHVAGVDPSREMVEQATTRNAGPIESGQVDLRLGAAESLPFGDNSFDKTFRDQLDAGVDGFRDRIERIAAGDESRRSDRARFHSIFGRTEWRNSRTTHRPWFHGCAQGDIGRGRLRARNQTMTEVFRIALYSVRAANLVERCRLRKKRPQ